MPKGCGVETGRTVPLGTALLVASVLGCGTAVPPAQHATEPPASTASAIDAASASGGRQVEPERSLASSELPSLKPHIVRPDRERPYRGFGSSVAVAGDLLAVGIPMDDVPRPGCGSVCLFRHDADRWHHFQTLRGDDISGPVGFAHHVAIGRSFVAVSAYAEPGHDFSGCVYVYEAAPSGEFRQTAKLYAADPHNSQAFGSSLAADGDRLIVGAYQDGGQGRHAGAAYIFEREENARWQQQAKLVGSDTAAGHHLGEAVAISGDHAAVSARHHPAGRGRTYLFQRQQDGRWTPQGPIDAPAPQKFTQFGKSLTMHAGTLFVGHWKSSRPVDSAGQAHLFTLSEQGQWQFARSVGAHRPVRREMLGFTVAADEAWLAAGTYVADEVTRGNTIYVYPRHGNTSVPQYGLTATAAGGTDFFGACLELSGNLLVVGDPVFEEPSSRSEDRPHRGAIFVYQLPRDETSHDDGLSRSTR